MIFTMNALPHHRPIRSFVRREGRITTAQQKALDTLWPYYGVADEGALPDLNTLFGRTAPRVLEIGFGNGESLAATAAAYPETDYLGIEVHRPGVGHLLKLLGEQELTNVRIICADACAVLASRLPDASLDRIQIFFPDPWPKKRHHKRRLIQPPFVALLADKLKPGGILHLATDWENYAEHMLSVLQGEARLVNTQASGSFAARPADRPPTKFERRGQRLGHRVYDLIYRRR